MTATAMTAMTTPAPAATAPETTPTPTPELAPLEYLAAAEHALADNRPLEGSHLLWQAVAATFARLGKIHHLDSGDLSALARALDRKEGRNCYYLGKLCTAQALMHNAELDYMEPCELESAGASVKRFIRDTP